MQLNVKEECENIDQMLEEIETNADYCLMRNLVLTDGNWTLSIEMTRQEMFLSKEEYNPKTPTGFIKTLCEQIKRGN